MSGAICGGRPALTTEKPKDWIDRGYNIVIPYPFGDYRETLGKVTCDCTQLYESFQPWYGTDYWHMDDCAIGKHLKRFPGIANLVDYHFPRFPQYEE